MQFSFNAAQFQPNYGNTGEGGLPAGKHKVILEKAEVVPSRNNPQNQYIKFTLKCIEGLAQGGTQIDRLNVYNSDQTAVKIANEQLAAYCAVMGKAGIQNDISELYNVPFYVEIGPQRDNPQYTEVKTYYDLSGKQPGAGQTQQAATQPPQGFAQANAPQQQWAPPAAAAPAPVQQFAPQPDPAAGQWGQAQPQAQPAAAPWSPGGQPNAPAWGQR